MQMENGVIRIMHIFLQENLKEEYSSLIDLHDRIRSLTGRDFVPVEKLKFFDLSTEETPADTQSIKKYEDKGVGEFNVDYAVTITGKLKHS